MIGIKGIASYFTGDKHSIQDLSEYGKLQDEEREYYNNVGIKTIYDADGCSAHDLALEASRVLLSRYNVAPESIDAILLVKSRVPEHFVSSEATRLQQELGALKALAFSVSDLGCVDSTLALKIARDLMMANPNYNRVLIAYGSKKFTPDRFRYPVTLTGDGGVACLIERTEENVIVDVEIETNGAFWDLFKIEYQDRTFSEYREECRDVRAYGFELALESRNRFSNLNRRLLERNQLSQEDIKNVMMQNISNRAFQYYEDAFGFKLSPFCKMNLSQYGHLGSGDILLNYQLGLQSKMIKPGDYSLILNNSPVAAWGSVLIKA